MIVLMRGFSIAWKSIQLNWLPALILQLIMLLLGFCYSFEISWTHAFFKALSEAKAEGGFLFSFSVGALAAGVFSEFFRVYFVDFGQWRREHFIDMIFKIFLMGGLSVLTDFFYQFQNEWFGSGADWKTLHLKVFVDMCFYSLFLTVPMNSLLFLWKEEGFDLKKTREQLFPLSRFFTNRFLPLWISNVCFWLPIVYVIYSMPALLQMPFNLIAATIWGILIVTISKESRQRHPLNLKTADDLTTDNTDITD